MMHFILDVVRVYFSQKAVDYYASAHYLLGFPKGSFVYTRGQLSKAMADLYSAIADSF